MTRWFDTGVNLTNSKLLPQADDIINRALGAGVQRMLVIGTSVAESEAALALCERYPAQLVASVGVHPHDAAAAPADFIERLRSLSQHPAVVAIGECGLDYNRLYSPASQQRQVFAAQLALAAERQLPVYLHERDAQQDQLTLLRQYREQIPAYFSHCFTGNKQALAAYLQLDCYIGITGWICDERRGQELQQAVLDIPNERLLLETDAPFLLPRNVRPRPRYNSPQLLPAIAEMVASLRQQSLSQLAEQCWQNSVRLFGATTADAIER